MRASSCETRDYSTSGLHNHCNTEGAHLSIKGFNRRSGDDLRFIREFAKVNVIHYTDEIGSHFRVTVCHLPVKSREGWRKKWASSSSADQLSRFRYGPESVTRICSAPRRTMWSDFPVFLK